MVKKGIKNRVAFYGAALETFYSELFALRFTDFGFSGQPHNSSGCCRACCFRCCCDVLSKDFIHGVKYTFSYEKLSRFSG